MNTTAEERADDKALEKKKTDDAKAEAEAQKARDKAAADAEKAAEKEKKAQKAAGWPGVGDILIVIDQNKDDRAPAITGSTAKIMTKEQIAARRAIVPVQTITTEEARANAIPARTLAAGGKGPLCLVNAVMFRGHTREILNVPFFATEEDAKSYWSAGVNNDANLAAYPHGK